MIRFHFTPDQVVDKEAEESNDEKTREPNGIRCDGKKMNRKSIHSNRRVQQLKSVSNDRNEPSSTSEWICPCAAHVTHGPTSSSVVNNKSISKCAAPQVSR